MFDCVLLDEAIEGNGLADITKQWLNRDRFQDVVHDHWELVVGTENLVICEIVRRK